MMLATCSMGSVSGCPGIGRVGWLYSSAISSPARTAKALIGPHCIQHTSWARCAFEQLAQLRRRRPPLPEAVVHDMCSSAGQCQPTLSRAPAFNRSRRSRVSWHLRAHHADPARLKAHSTLILYCTLSVRQQPAHNPVGHLPSSMVVVSTPPATSAAVTLRQLWPQRVRLLVAAGAYTVRRPPSGSHTSLPPRACVVSCAWTAEPCLTQSLRP